MKKLILLTILWSGFVHLEATWSYRACQGLVLTTAASTTYGTFAALKNNSNSREKSTEISESQTFFDDSKQKLFKQHFTTAYQLDKPLKIGIFTMLGIAENFKDNASALLGKDANYIMMGHNLAKTPKNLLPLNVEKYENSIIYRYSDPQELKNYYSYMSDEKFIKTLKDKKPVINHEIAHLVHNDHENTFNLIINRTIAYGALLMALNAYNIKKTFSQSNSKLGLLGKVLTVYGATIATNIETRMATAKLSREQEIKADDFAIQRATSKEELEDFKKFFEETPEKNTSTLNLRKNTQWQ